MKVLIVDDSTMVCQRLTALLGSVRGLSICGWAHDVSSALESVAKQEPEIVLLDAHIRGKSGVDVLDGISQRKNSSTVIVMTNNPAAQSRRRFMAAGADFLFDKSLEFEELISLCRNLVHKGRGRSMRIHEKGPIHVGSTRVRSKQVVQNSNSPGGAIHQQHRRVL
jgi:DNA-binding response OmpR family regulator